MARSEARVSVEIWAPGSDFTTLTLGAQWMYEFLLSQQDLAHTGVIALRARRWSRAARGLTVEAVEAYITELADSRYVVVDEDTEELLVRSLIRRDKIYRQPNVLRAAADQLPLVTSEVIRRALATELSRIVGENMPEASRAILAEMRAALPTPTTDVPAGDKGSRNPSPNPSGKGSSDQQPIDRNPTDSTPGVRGVVTAVSNGFPVPRSPETPPPAGRELATRDDPDTAQTLIGEWIDHCRKRPPGAVIGQIGKQIKAMLAEGIDPADIRRGLAAWHGKDLHPSALPSLVNEAMNGHHAQARASPRPSTTDQRIAQAAAAGERVQAMLDRREITDGRP